MPIFKRGSRRSLATSIRKLPHDVRSDSDDAMLKAAVDANIAGLITHAGAYRLGNMIDRTFAWISRDPLATLSDATTVAAFVRLAMIRVMLGDVSR